MSTEFQIGVAGLGIGAFSGILDVLSSCNKLYGMWRAMRGLDSHLNILRAKLLLQHALLEQWQRDWLIFPVTPRQTQNVRRQSLVKLHELAIIETLNATHSLLQDLEPLLHATSQNEKMKTGMIATANRMIWASSKALDSQKTLDQLESLLGGLYRLLPPRIPNTEASQVILSIEDITDDMGTAETLSGTGTPKLQLAGPTSIFGCSILQKAISFRNLNTELEQDLKNRISNFMHQRSTKNLAIKGSRIQVKRNDDISAGLRSFGILDGKESVIIEWKTYDASWQGQKGIALTGRILNISHLLNSETKPVELLTLKCLGVFDDPQRNAYGFVFRLPPESTSSSIEAQVVSLKALLDTPSPENLPTLEDRYNAAYALSLSLSVIHGVSWLHKSIRSHNVLFPVSASGRPFWSRPYIVGFEFSRPDSVDESSEKPEQSARFNVYRHPKAQGTPGEGYQRAFDIYSLGVILAELAMWRPIWKMYKDGMGSETFQKALVSKVHDWIAHLMGSQYSNATLTCLGENIENGQDRTVQSFYINVVEVLGRVVAETM
uniref:Protein kinase domain-containing protein n=1 Tax=Colletotrichum fructicola (strain Nara gc5) TaxID=1213859 RepID=L2FZ65_COLFN